MPIKTDADGRQYVAEDDWYARPLNKTVDTGLAPSGQGRYQDLYDANPYRNLEYRQSGWQRFLSNLGFRTSYDDFVDQAKINAAEYDAGIASMQFQNEYNTPTAEADRERAAGLNPDLQGLGDVAESAAPTEDPNGMPPQNSEQQAQQAWSAFQSFGQLVMSSFSAGMALYKEFIGLDGLKVDNDAKFANVIDNMILEHVNGVEAQDQVSVMNQLESIAQAVDDDLKYPELFAGYSMSRRKLEKLRPRVRARLLSLFTDEGVFNQFAKRNTALSSMARSRSDEFYSESQQEDDLLDVHSRVLREGSRELNEITQRVSKHAENIKDRALDNQGISLDIEQQKLDELYANDAGYKMAHNELEGLIGDTYLKRFNSVLNKTKSNLVRELEILAERGNRMAKTELYYMTLHDFINFDFKATLDAGWNKNGGLFGQFLPHIGIEAEAQMHLK